MEGSEQGGSLPFVTYTERFHEQFPYYLSIGMTPDQYWNGDPEWARAFRKADEMRMERKNQELWLQGMYFYEAMGDVAPILHAFAKKGTKPTPYPSKPYALTNKQRERDEEEKQRKLAEKGKRFMEAMAASLNKKFEGKTQSKQ